MLIFKQDTPSSTWTITHSEVGMPTVSVTVLNNGKQELMYPASVEIVNATTVKISFTMPFTGTATVRFGGI